MLNHIKVAKAILERALEDGVVGLSEVWGDDDSLDPGPADPRNRPDEELVGVTQILDRHFEKAVLLGMMVRTECRDGHWTAWFIDAPQVSFGGDSEPAAVRALLRSEGRTETCDACGGSGKYQGLHALEACNECGGSGTRP
jgi:hypothetical protein